MGKGSSSKEKSSQLEMGDVWLGGLATSQFGDLGQIYSSFASWLPHEEFLKMRDLGNPEESELCSEGSFQAQT